jgi:hypothetical protein
MRTAFRNRHTPRLCGNCHAPMASGTDTCWRCGVQWASEDQPATTLRLVSAPPGEPQADPQPAARRVARAGS